MADIPDGHMRRDIDIRGWCVSVHVQQEEWFSACSHWWLTVTTLTNQTDVDRLHHTFLSVTHSSVGVSDFTLTEETCFISTENNVLSTSLSQPSKRCCLTHPSFESPSEAPSKSLQAANEEKEMLIPSENRREEKVEKQGYTEVTYLLLACMCMQQKLETRPILQTIKKTSLQNRNQNVYKSLSASMDLSKHEPLCTSITNHAWLTQINTA